MPTLVIEQLRWTLNYFTPRGQKYRLHLRELVAGEQGPRPVAAVEGADDLIVAWHMDGSKETFASLDEMAARYSSYIELFESIEEN